MNPDRIYSQYRDNALAKQMEAKSYSTFVAMPFKEYFSYRSREIYNEVILKAASRATKIGETPHKFDPPKRIDDEPGVAGVITEDIIVKILESHLFLADLTFENPGVIGEVGVALGLKPNKQIILILQGDPNDLHFDIRNNRVIRYDQHQEKTVESLAHAFIAGAKAFEDNREKAITAIKRTLTPEAILCLNWYGRLCRDKPRKKPSLHLGAIEPNLQTRKEGVLLYSNALRELVGKRLLWTDYTVKATSTGDSYGMHATELGWKIIEHMWPELKRSE